MAVVRMVGGGRPYEILRFGHRAVEVAVRDIHAIVMLA
jgi:hypothetical protein